MKPMTIIRRSRKRKWLLIGFIVFVVLTLAMLIAANVWYRNQLNPVSSSDEVRYVTIESGTSSAQVANLLADQGLIRDAFAFRLHARLTNTSQGIQAGLYGLSPNQSATEILRILTSGETESVMVRIPGGSELAQIVDIFVEAGFEESEVKQALEADYDNAILRDRPRGASLEGYLFPDTYYASAKANPSEVIAMAITNTENKLTDEILGAWAEKGLDIHEGLTLASIVQKEAPDPRTQELVAQVFLRRLAEGMMLQADPTYLYAARQMGVSASPQLVSPYNTYRVGGLPPGPIAASELSVLEAVANPAETDYLFFVTGTDGVTRFSRTQDEHDAYIRAHGISGV